MMKLGICTEFISPAPAPGKQILFPGEVFSCVRRDPAHMFSALRREPGNKNIRYQAINNLAKLNNEKLLNHFKNLTEFTNNSVLNE